MAAKNSLVIKRTGIVLLVITVLLLLFLVRLFWVQIVWGKELKEKAEKFRTKKVVLTPQRGNIYDRNHNELVSSIPAFSVYVRPDEVTDLREFSGRIAPFLNMDSEEIYKKVSTKEPFIWVKHKLNFEAAEKIKKLNLKGVGIIKTSARSYKQGNICAHLLGFVGNDNQGLTGIEKSYENELRGKPGYVIVESDAAGQPIIQAITRVYPSRPGYNLVLTVDQTIQYFVERELDNIVAIYQPAWASILVMDPKTGEVLAMGNRPTFDPEHWNEAPQQVWDKNKAVLYNYEPGSVLKMFIAAAALEEKVVRKTDYFYCPGYIKVSGRRIHCWKREGHKGESFTGAMANSCNVALIQVGMRLGKERVYKYLKAFGFGVPTGIDLPGEETGIVKPEQNVTDLDLAAICMGQSISVTPIQLLNAVCAVANGGKLMKPYLVKEIINEKGKTIKQIKPRIKRQVISKDTARELSLMLEEVVLKGTGKKAYIEGYRAAGKTGTAQIPGPKGYVSGKYIASFAGFAPVDDPRVASLIIIAEPKGVAYHGGEVAAPVFQALIRNVLDYLGVPQSRCQQVRPVKDTQTNLSRSRVPVPNVVGLPLTEALQVLEKSGLNVWYSGEGIVQGQIPEKGKMVSRGRIVSLKLAPYDLNNPKEYLIVPELKGLTLKKAGMVLEELGLNFKPKGSGYAIKQNPVPGEKVKPGTVVEVLFVKSSKPGNCSETKS